MKQYIKISIPVVLALGIAALLFGVAFATPELVPATNSRGGTDVVIPHHVIEKAPGVFSLGVATDPETGKSVEGYVIYHHRPNHGGGPGGGGGGNATSTSSCYELFARGAKWKSVEPWIMNTSNIDGLSGSEVFGLMEDGVDKWEDAADGIVDNSSSIDIVGAGSTTGAFLSADMVSPDGNNEVYFADISDSGSIGVTIVWGIFSGPPNGRELLEWDQVYDDIDFDWGTDGSSALMDFESTATHELGHTVGLADLYTSSCDQETMYGYGSEGDTYARDLNGGDVTGISKLY